MSTQKTAGWRWASVNDAGRAIGQYHHSAKLDDDDVELILNLRAEGLSLAQIAAKFDDGVRISKRTVHAICRGEKRSQTVMGHKLVPLPRSAPADPGEFD